MFAFLSFDEKDTRKTKGIKRSKRGVDVVKFEAITFARGKVDGNGKSRANKETES